MLRSKNPQQVCSSNATWSPPSRNQFCEKRTKSESHLVKNGSKEEAEKSVLISPEEDLRELLSALHTHEFCGKMNPTNFDHSLDDDEWVRLPSRRGGGGSGEEKKTKRVIIPTPKEMYDEPHSCDTTVSSAASGDSGKKRSRGAFEYPLVTKENEAVSVAHFRRRLPQFERATSMPLPKRTQKKEWNSV